MRSLTPTAPKDEPAVSRLEPRITPEVRKGLDLMVFQERKQAK